MRDLHKQGLNDAEMQRVWLSKVRACFRRSEFVVAREGRALLRVATTSSSHATGDDTVATTLPLRCIDSAAFLIWSVVDKASRALIEKLINWDKRFTRGLHTAISNRKLSYMAEMWQRAEHKVGTNSCMDLQKLRLLGDTGLRKWNNDNASDDEDDGEVCRTHVTHYAARCLAQRVLTERRASASSSALQPSPTAFCCICTYLYPETPYLYRMK